MYTIQRSMQYAHPVEKLLKERIPFNMQNQEDYCFPCR